MRIYAHNSNCLALIVYLYCSVLLLLLPCLLLHFRLLHMSQDNLKRKGYFDSQFKKPKSMTLASAWLLVRASQQLVCKEEEKQVEFPQSLTHFCQRNIHPLIKADLLTTFQTLTLENKLPPEFSAGKNYAQTIAPVCTFILYLLVYANPHIRIFVVFNNLYIFNPPHFFSFFWLILNPVSHKVAKTVPLKGIFSLPLYSCHILTHTFLDSPLEFSSS